MKTKWYSDFWRLFVSPFSGGIDQVVQSGTLQKGFWGTVFLWAIPYIILALFGTMLIPFLPHNEFTGLTYLIGIGASFIFITVNGRESFSILESCSLYMRLYYGDKMVF